MTQDAVEPDPDLWPRALSKLVRHESLDADEAAEAMRRVMAGEATPGQVGGLLMALRTKGETAELAQAGEAAYRHLADGIERLRGVSPLEDTSAMADAIALWSMAQGFAGLFISGRLKSLLQMSKTQREELLKGILLRAVA